MQSWQKRDGVVLLAIGMVLATGCLSGDDKEDTPRAAQAVRAPDGSLRRPFLGGAFVTYNSEMPIEIEQAIAGEPTDRPVVVWAGN